MELLNQIHQMVWGPWTLAIFLGTGLFFTIKSRFFQIRGFPFWWSRTAGSLWKRKGETKKEGANGGISQFQSVCTALAATIGTGNIAGVATALAAGGPGALFWMWISAAIGMMTAYGETMLGVKFCQRDGWGGWIGGPFVYMEKGLNARWMGKLYGFLCLMCALGMGSMVQANAAAEALSYSSQVPQWVWALVLTSLAGLTAAGGIQRIGAAAEKLIPWAAGLYLFFSLTILLSCAGRLPQVFGQILAGAFAPQAALGGSAGWGLSLSLRYGMARGVFSNEAGLGTLAVLHSTAAEAEPEEQGMWAMFEVFFDTIVLCTLTGLVILCAGNAWESWQGLQGAALVSWAFGTWLGAGGSLMVSIFTAVFAFGTMTAWFYMGLQAAWYLTRGLNGERGRAGRDRKTERIYRALFLGAVCAGGAARLEPVWLLSDIWNGLMAFPNLTALLFLAGQVRLPGKKAE